jgi:hypothetical protein
MGFAAMKRLLSLIFACVCLLGFASAGTILPGSIQGQDGWSGGKTGAIAADVDQQVTNAASYAGTQSLRVSNKGHNGAFDGWVFGPGLADAAGQPSSKAPADVLEMSLFFRSVSATADGSNLELDLGNSTGDDRTTFTAITNFSDADGGLTLRANEPDATGNFAYSAALVAQSLSRTAWHELDIVAYFLDGTANDYFQIFLDDPTHAHPMVSPNTGLPRWRTFEAYNAALDGPYNLSNRLYIRSGLPASGYGLFADNAVSGFYIDNVSYETWNSADPGTILSSYSTGFEDLSGAPEPGSLSLLTFGLGAVWYARRRRG